VTMLENFGRSLKWNADLPVLGFVCCRRRLYRCRHHVGYWSSHRNPHGVYQQCTDAEMKTGEHRRIKVPGLTPERFQKSVFIPGIKSKRIHAADSQSTDTHRPL
jgi:hypothetical protein